MVYYLRLLALGVIVSLAFCIGVNANCAVAQFASAGDDRVSQANSESTIPAQTNGARPTPLLRGGTVEQSSPLWIIQRKARLFRTNAEFNTFVPSRASAAEREIEVQTQRSKPLTGDLDDNNWILPERTKVPNRTLHGGVFRTQRFIVPHFYSLHPTIDAAIRDEPVLGMQSPSLSPDESDRVSREIDSQFHRRGGPGIQFKQVKTSGNPGIERQFDIPIGTSGTSAAFASAQARLMRPAVDATSEISSQLKRANRPKAVPDVEAELRAEQAVAKPLLDKQAALASSELRAVFRRLSDAPADLETEARLVAGNADARISWDAWYARVAKLSEPLLVKAVEASGGPGGTSTVSITVRANHHVLVTLVDSTNASFAGAIVRAYRGLDGNSALAFPSGSQRTEVTFLADNHHAAPGDVSNVSTQSCVGDTEAKRKR